MSGEQKPTVTYHAVSLLSSRTFWLNAAALAVAVLSATEVAQIIPPRYVGLYGALLAGLNIVLRTQTTRPVAFVAPGETKAVQVDKLSPPRPPGITD